MSAGQDDHIARGESGGAAAAARPITGVFLAETTEGQEIIGVLTKQGDEWVFAEKVVDARPPEQDHATWHYAQMADAWWNGLSDDERIALCKQENGYV